MRIKICCISNVEEANTAIKFGADAIGLVAKMPDYTRWGINTRKCKTGN